MGLSKKIKENIRFDFYTKKSKMKLFLNNFSYFFRRKKNQISRTIDFLPLIWNGFDFDYKYSLDLFKHQLKRTADFMESEDALTVDANIRAKKIRTAIKLMDKVYEEDYACEYIDIIEKKYGKTKFEFIPIDDGEYSELKTTNEFVNDEFQQNELDKTKHELILLCREKQEKAHKLLWSFIEHNIRSWWD
jgi:hypothetical protein